MGARLSIVMSLATWLLACAMPVNVVVDAHEDFSQYRAWDWLPGSVEPRDIHSLTFDAHVTEVVEREFAARGFERSSHEAEFFVRYHLALQRRRLVVEEPRAANVLSSHHSSPSYVIQGSHRKVIETFDVGLLLEVSDAAGRTIWVGTLQRRGDAVPFTVQDAASRLCEHLPMHADLRSPPAGP